MKFHKYGPVEIAITEDQYGEPTTHAKFEGVEYTDGSGEASAFWQRTSDGHWLDGEDEKESRTVRMLDAAASLCWYKYEAFQAADARMGDPNP